MDDIRPIKPRQQPPQPNRPRQVSQQPAAQRQSQQPLAGIDLPLLEAEADSVKKPRKKLKWIIGVLVVILLLLGAGLGYAAYWYNDALQPRSSATSRVRITIEPGSTAESIGRLLEEKGVIRSGLAFQLYVKQAGVRDKLQAGDYLFSPTQSVKDIVAWLTDGKVDSYNVTILPGKSLSEIKDKLIKDGFDAAAIDAAFAKQYDHALLKDKPATVNLEGYIFPETYNITSETTVEQLLVKTFDEFYKRIESKNLVPALSARGFNLHTGITLASLVQLEVATDADRRQVAQVFEKRLQVGMPLGSDVSFIYAAKLTGQPISIDIDSPYNTRRYAGLPPGAVANFNFSALEAVANPALGDYLFFVSGDDGVTHFSRTGEEHQQNIDRYCTKLCGN